MKHKIIVDTKEKITEKWIQNSNVKLLEKWTLFMSFKLSLWKLAFAWKNLYTNEAIAWLPIKNTKEIDKYFLYYFLLWYNFLKNGTDNSVKWATLNKEKLKQIQIPLPPLPTQQKIVEKLDTVLEKIEKNIELTKQNLANIEEQNTSILEKIFKECEEEFEMKELERVCEKITDWSHNPPKGIEKGYPMISSRNLESNKIMFDNIRYLSEEDYLKENKRTDAQEWDILLSIVWTIWKVAIVKEEYWKFVMQRSLALLKLKQNILSPEFIYYCLCSQSIQMRLLEGAKWATQKWIYLKDIKQIQIPLPPLSKQQEIVNYLDNIFAKNAELKHFYQKNLENLEELKQSILKEAFENEDFVQ